MIHRAVLGQGPSQLRSFFVQAGPAVARLTRRTARSHDKQLKDVREGRFTEVIRRSALGAIAVYNMLPQAVVDIETVKMFQSTLQKMIRDRMHLGETNWALLLSPRVPMYRHLLRKL